MSPRRSLSTATTCWLTPTCWTCWWLKTWPWLLPCWSPARSTPTTGVASPRRYSLELLAYNPPLGASARLDSPSSSSSSASGLLQADPGLPAHTGVEAARLFPRSHGAQHLPGGPASGIQPRPGLLPSSPGLQLGLWRHHGVCFLCSSSRSVRKVHSQQTTTFEAGLLHGSVSLRTACDLIGRQTGLIRRAFLRWCAETGGSMCLSWPCKYTSVYRCVCLCWGIIHRDQTEPLSFPLHRHTHTHTHTQTETQAFSCEH